RPEAWPVELVQLLAGLHFPETSGPVIAAREDPLAVGRDSQAPDALLVVPDAAQFLTRLQIPQTHRVVVPSGHGPLAVRQESDAVHVILVARETAQLLARL